MADRHTLHKNHIAAFKEWLITDGWALEETKGFYEALRARKGKRLLILYERSNYQKSGGDHYTVMDKDIGVIRAFLRDNRRNKNVQ